MKHKYYWDDVRVWYLGKWKETCKDCGKVSPEAVCLSCGTPKEYSEEEVTDKPTVRILEMWDRKKKKELERILNEQSKEEKI